MKLPSYRWRLAHLAALWGYGVSQPVFSMLKGNPEFLVVRGSTRSDVIVFALLLAFVPPAVVVAVEALSGLASRKVSGALHVVAVGVFGFLALLQLTRLLEIERRTALLLPLVLALFVPLLYLKVRPFRLILSLSCVLPIVGVFGFVASVPLAVDDAAAADVRVAHPVPVVLVVFDEFPVSSIMRPDGSIDAVRYPNFARLVRDGTWYPRATAVHEYTTQAVPAILTGLLPRQGELPTLADHPKNIFTLLGERYSIESIEPVTRLCPSRYCPDAHGEPPPLIERLKGLSYDVGLGYLYRVLPAAARGGLPPIGSGWSDFGQDDEAAVHSRIVRARDIHDVDRAIEQSDQLPVADFNRFLRMFNRGWGERSFFFLHSLLPHAPWRFLPTGDEYANSLTIDGMNDQLWSRWDGSPDLVRQALQRHLLQVGYTDRLLGALLRRLDATRLFDRALIIVTADHGVSFEPSGLRRSVTRRNLQDIAGVPLFVKYPGQRSGRIDDRSARTIDIVPTIADVAGARIPWHVDGRSLRDVPVVREVSVARKDGGRVEAPAGSVFAGVEATARRNAEFFQTGASSMYRIGPFKELLGRSSTVLLPSETTTSRVHIDGDTLYTDVRPGSGFVPARVLGEIQDRSVGPGRALAIGVNGRIAATTWSYELDGTVRFATLVPEAVFRNGANVVDVYSIGRADGQLALTRLGGTARRSQYALSRDGRSILLPQGKRAPVVSGRIAGKVESAVREGDTVRVRGWAADLRTGRVVDRVLVFSGQRLVFVGGTGSYRWDIPDVAGHAGLKRVGFVAEFPLRDVGRGIVHVFAIRGTAASEMSWSESAERSTSNPLATARSGGR